MSVTELLPALQALPRPDKLRLVQFLVGELAREEGVIQRETPTYPIWSPYNAFEAASTLLDALDSQKPTP